ncbi:MAG: TetR/AcrR family transcriptional regulator [Tissierellia bacterium]|nr:TetR/AcrR family transcriptional regulator [Tissierellia bacterium]
MEVKIPKTKKGKLTLFSLCVSAENMFKNKGFHGTTIKDITNDAGVGLGTFYVYFKSKKSIYDYLLLQYSHKIRSQIAKNIQAHRVGSKKEMERIGIRTFLQIVLENPHIYNIIWESLYIDKTLFVNYYTNFAEHYANSIKAGQTEGEIYDDIDPEVLAFSLMGISNFVGLRWTMFEKSEEKLDYVTDNIMKLLEHGMFTNKEK